MGLGASNAYMLDGRPEKLGKATAMNNIEKLDNVTWYGHCVIHLMTALNDLPEEAKLDFCQDLSKFIKRQHKLLLNTAA
jgi:hypothetical protein